MTPRIAYPRQWRDALPPSLPLWQRAWLQQPGALTAGLRRLGQVDLSVRRETVLALPADWAHEAGLATGTPVWWREILMRIRGTACVQACSFTPFQASQAAWKSMRGLGPRPLADILYHDARIRRSAFRFGQLTPGHTDWAIERTPGEILARHSVFTRCQAPLLVAEYFLPAFWGIASTPGATAPRRQFPRYGFESLV